MNDHFLDFFNISVGAFYIIAAFLCKKYPRLIAGNNNFLLPLRKAKLTQASKEQVQIFFQGLLILGLLTMALGPLLWTVDNDIAKILSAATLALVGFACIFIAANRQRQ